MNVNKKWYAVLLALVVVALCVSVCPAFRVGAEEILPDGATGTDIPIPEPSVVEQIADAVIEKLENTDAEDFGTYFKETLLPIIVTAVSAIVALYVAVYPLICKAKSVTDRFKSNAKDCADAAGGFADAVRAVEAAKTQGEEARAEAEALMRKQTEEMKRVVETVIAENAKLRDEILAMKKDCENAERIARIGFGNLKELVAGGIASEIAKVGKEESGNAEETDRA